MIRIFLLVVGFSLQAIPAFAERLIVRSGEHTDFTRLVVKIPKGTNWSFDPNQGGGGLTVELPDVVFDVSSVFSRIPRGRLDQLEQKKPGEALLLTYGCHCVASTFVEAGTFLVVDIRQATLPETGPVELPIVVSSLPRITSSFLGDPAHNPSEPTAVVDSSGPKNPSGSKTSYDSMRQTELRLLTELSRAVDQDLLDVSPPGNVASIQAESSRSKTNAGGLSNLSDNFRISSAFDLNDQPSFNESGSLTHEVDCSVGEGLDVLNWKNQRNFVENIGSLRNVIFDAAGAIDVNVVSTLAQKYIYFGFGREAAQMLSLLSEDTQTSTNLLMLAELIDELPLETSVLLKGLQSCNGAVPMWSLLADGELSSAANVQSIMTAFSKLPEHLQIHLGPRLADLFVQADDMTSARAILRVINRVQPILEPESLIVEAEVEKSKESADEYLEKLEEIVEDTRGSDQSPRALISLVEERWRKRQGFEEVDAGLLETFAYEYRDDELGNSLRGAYITALALGGNFDEAFNVLSEKSVDRDPKTLNRILTLLSERGSDVSFLRFVLDLDHERSEVLKDETITLVASRLIELGFFSQSMDLLERQPKKGVQENWKVLRAKAALGLNLPHRAQLELLEVPGAIAASLRADALIQLGKLSAAATQLENVGKVEDASRNYWLMGDWERMPSEGNKYSRAAELTQRLQNPGETGTLAKLTEVKRLVNNSEEVRSVVDELLTSIE